MPSVRSSESLAHSGVSAWGSVVASKARAIGADDYEILSRTRLDHTPGNWWVDQEKLSENSRKRRGEFQNCRRVCRGKLRETLLEEISPKLLRVSGGCLGMRRRRRTWGSCDKPRGAANQALIRGSPNGATHRGSYLDILI